MKCGHKARLAERAVAAGYVGADELIEVTPTAVRCGLWDIEQQDSTLCHFRKQCFLNGRT